MITTTRSYVSFPYVSKSSYISWKYGCPYKFKQVYLEGRRNTPNMAMVSGTSIHHLFDIFFDEIDYDKLWSLPWAEAHDTPHSFIYNYFLSIIEAQLPENTVNNHILRNIKSFCRMEENHWFGCRSKYNNKGDVFKYFRPLAREKFVKFDVLKVFGTRDRDILEDSGRVLIFDYKTGRVPKNADLLKKDGIYCQKMARYKVSEGNYYGMLWLLEHGYNFEYTKVDKRDKPMWDCYKDGVKIKIDFLDFGFGYTNANPTVVTRKKVNMVAIRTILNDLPKMRDVSRPFDREPNPIRCKRCDLFITDCQGVVDFEIYRNVLGRTESTPTLME